MDHWFERLNEQITLAHNESAVRATLHRLSVDAGFSGYAYLSIQAEKPAAISNYAEEWQARYFECGYSSVDPVVLTAKDRREAFAWSNVSSSRMTPERRKFYGEAAEFGIRSGITVPIKTGFARWAFLTLASSEVDFAEKLTLNPVAAASAFGQVHSRLELMQIGPVRTAKVRLKADELTCLRWSAEGKSMKDIADIENTTYANVCFFLRNAKKALGALTLPQATALAKELGLI